jgi:methionyl-tRNA formyltransferase
MKPIAITSSHSRHREFIEVLSRNVDLTHIFVVDKSTGDDEFEISQHRFFGKRKRKEIKANIIKCTPNQLRSRRAKEMMLEINPDICFVFGAPLLTRDIYTIPSMGCINIHTGLVQYHRGVDSPYWAIDENNLSAIGATLHYIDSSIDGGNVIAQRQTQDLSIEDTADDVFMKTCITGFDILKENMYNILNNSVEVTPLLGKGKLFQAKDMTFEKKIEIRFKASRYLKEYLSGNNRRSM